MKKIPFWHGRLPQGPGGFSAEGHFISTFANRFTETAPDNPPLCIGTIS